MHLRPQAAATQPYKQHTRIHAHMRHKTHTPCISPSGDQGKPLGNRQNNVTCAGLDDMATAQACCDLRGQSLSKLVCVQVALHQVAQLSCRSGWKWGQYHHGERLASPVLAIPAWLCGSCVARDNCLEARWRHCTVRGSHSSTSTAQHSTTPPHTSVTDGSTPADWRSATCCAPGRGLLSGAACSRQCLRACGEAQRERLAVRPLGACALTALVEAGGPELLREGPIGAQLHGGALQSCWLCWVKRGSWHTSSTAADSKNEKSQHSTLGSVALATKPSGKHAGSVEGWQVPH